MAARLNGKPAANGQLRLVVDPEPAEAERPCDRLEEEYFEAGAELTKLREQEAEKRGFMAAWESRPLHPDMDWETAYGRWNNGEA